MAAPVWLLTVDLQTKTASFTTGLADAAKSARGAFRDIGAGADEMGGTVGRSSIDVRHSLGLVDNVIRGAHAQAMADLVRMWAQSALVMSTLPIAATAAGFALIGGIVFEVAEKIKQLKLEHEKLTDDMLRFGTTADEAYRGLADRLLEAERHTDELRNDHLGALRKQLELIDHQSMGELIKALDSVAKASDEVFKDLQGHWYTFWKGSSEGAKHSLDEFQVRYKAMLAGGDESGASNALHDKLRRELQVLKDQKAAASVGAGEETDESWAAKVELQRIGASYSQKDIEAQQQLVDLLQRQVKNEEVINKLKNQDGKNARLQAGNEEQSRRAEAARQSAESMLQLGQQSIAADKATADAVLTVHRASLEQRLASDVEFAGRERDVKLAANRAEIAALDQSGKDYANQLKALNEKALEIQQEYQTKIATLKATESVAANERDLRALEQSEREKIEATQQGSAARLAAINAAIREEEANQLTLTQFYRDLLTARVEEQRREVEAENQDRERATREAARNAETMAEMQLEAEKQRVALEDSTRHVSMARQIAEAEHFANEEYAIRMAALQQEIAGLDKSGREYEEKLRELQDREAQLTQAHENEIAAIKDKALIEQNRRVAEGYRQFSEITSEALTQSIMGHQTWSQALIRLGDEVISSRMQEVIKSAMLDDFDKERDAAKAARKFFLAGAQLPFPANIVAAPVLAAGAFATVMAFAKGTDMVPGVGRGDVVPAMLSPGEGVVPGGVMDGLRNVARNGGFDQRPSMAVHVRPTYHINALDQNGIQDVLDRHSDQLQRHFESTLRKMNR